MQVNGKLRGKLSISTDEANDEAKVKALALADERIAKYATAETAKKIIFVPKAHILNIVV